MALTGLYAYFALGGRFWLLSAGFGVFLIAYWWVWERKRRQIPPERPFARRSLVISLVSGLAGAVLTFLVLVLFDLMWPA